MTTEFDWDSWNANAPSHSDYYVLADLVLMNDARSEASNPEELRSYIQEVTGQSAEEMMMVATIEAATTTEVTDDVNQSIAASWEIGFITGLRVSRDDDSINDIDHLKKVGLAEALNVDLDSFVHIAMARAISARLTMTTDAVDINEAASDVLAMAAVCWLDGLLAGLRFDEHRKELSRS